MNPIYSDHIGDTTAQQACDRCGRPTTRRESDAVTRSVRARCPRCARRESSHNLLLLLILALGVAVWAMQFRPF
ncbi:MAG TPA: hypothetical protein VGM03_01520 [Phycisphaerae bacterium]|jgi:hypothetical protein